MSIRRVIVPAVLIAAVATGCKRPAEETAAPAATAPAENTVPVRPEPVTATPSEPAAPAAAPAATPPAAPPALEELQNRLAALTDKLQGLNMASGLFGDAQLNEILEDFSLKAEAARMRLAELQESGEANTEEARRELAGMIGEVQAADAQAVERIKQLR